MRRRAVIGGHEAVAGAGERAPFADLEAELFNEGGGVVGLFVVFGEEAGLLGAGFAIRSRASCSKPEREVRMDRMRTSLADGGLCAVPTFGGQVA